MQINKHSTFYIRNGWPTKIFDAISIDPLIFSPNFEVQAVDTIGVGRVMIKAMRYWSTAMGISSESKSQHGVIHSLTSLGKLIYSNDPYCQNIGTLWLLHRNLARNYDDATAWAWAFNENPQRSFSKESFTNNLYSFLQTNGFKSCNKASVEKEFDCFKNTYVSDKKFDLEKIIDEDTIPFFAPLRLISYSGGGIFEMRKSSANDIPLDIIFYCILSDNKDVLTNNQQISIDTLYEDKCQIGKYMNLSYASLLELLQSLDNRKLLSLTNNFGNRYIQLANVDEEKTLVNYYKGIAR